MNTSPATPVQLDFEPLEDRILFSASPLGAMDVPEDAGQSGSTVEISEDALKAYENNPWLPTDQEEVKAVVLEESEGHALVWDGSDADDDLIAGILLDNQEIDFSNEDAVSMATDEVQDRLELLFVDTRIVGFAELTEDLVANAAAGVELVVVTFDPTRDGLLQISEALGYYGTDDRAVEAMHVISHAMPGQMRIGTTSLTDQSFAQQEVVEAVQGWKDFLSEDADILLYGCSLAGSEAGVDFIQNLSVLTGADVAASIDETGSEELGGNWTLELAIGSVETVTLFSTLDILLDATPQISVSAADNPFVNEPFDVSIHFENVGADVGYGPFVDLRVSEGVEVVGGDNGFTYLGLPVNVLGSFSYDDLAAGDPLHVPGDPIFVDHPNPA